jgi:membrane associated rhomboid family serine protease
MIPIRDERDRGPFPWVTVTLLVLLAIIYLWDRGWHILGSRFVFADMAARPVDIVSALKGGVKEPLITLFTSIFLHANLQHILSNVIFLYVFGPRVEHTFGPWRFVLYYLFFGVAAAITQVAVMPDKGVPMLGASGAIAGVMGCYLLLFPAAKIEAIVFPFIGFPFSVPAWLLLGLWFIFQILFAQPGVANWAHVGGFLAGMVIVFVTRPRKPYPKPDLPELNL